MNIHEGARRIQVIGRALLSFAGILLVLGLLTALVGHLIPGSSLSEVVSVGGIAALLIAITVYLALPGLALLLLGWVIDGFSDPPNPFLGE